MHLNDQVETNGENKSYGGLLINIGNNFNARMIKSMRISISLEC